MSRQKRKQPWMPLVPAKSAPNKVQDRELQTLVQGLAEMDGTTIWMNDRYTVARREQSAPGVPSLVHLSIRSNDHSAIRDWRDMQRIKNELIGPEEEAVELYPAESRLCDTSNQFHIWCFKGVVWPFGFSERLVGYPESGSGAVQRKWEEGSEPADAKVLTNEDSIKWLKEVVKNGGEKNQWR